MLFRLQPAAVRYDLATRRADSALAALTGKITVLPRLRPANSAEERRVFFEHQGAYDPQFTYAPLGFDEAAYAQTLHALDFSAVPDVEMRALFEGKRSEMLIELTLLRARGTAAFGLASIALHGRPSKDDVRIAEQILALPPEDTPAELSPQQVKRALDAYAKTLRKQAPLPCKVRILDGRQTRAAATSRAVLLASDARFTRADAASLCAHEIGWHLLTARNGRCQPLHIFRDGVAGYLGDQEGGAVYQELLTPEALTVSRLRTLALRTVAVDLALAGHRFSEVFGVMVGYGLSLDSAYAVCERVYRGGLFTKDALYLHHFLRVLRAARKGALDLATFAAGKMRLEDVPLVARQIEEGLLRPARLLPTTHQGLAHVPHAIRRALAL